jgi:anti-anti-sigma factor
VDQLIIEVDGHPPVVRLIGEVDVSNVDELASRLEELRTSGFPLAIDLSELRFIDSSGIRVLLSEARVMNGRGPLVLKRPSATFVKVMQIIGAFEVRDLEIVIE